MEVMVFFVYFAYMAVRMLTQRGAADYGLSFAFLAVTWLTFCMEDSKHTRLCRSAAAVLSLGCFGTVCYQYTHNVFSDRGLVCQMVFWGLLVFQSLLPEKPCKIRKKTI
jgi:hypothetical protein